MRKILVIFRKRFALQKKYENFVFEGVTMNCHLGTAPPSLFRNLASLIFLADQFTI